MDHLILHPTTHGQLRRFTAKPSHALLLTGPSGIGKTAIAEAVAAELLGISADKLAMYPYFLALRPTGTSISIDAIRELQRFLQLKTVGEQPLRRVVSIEQAHTLTTEAQNAYLKLLEEPPADTLLLLTATSPRALLPTILSRVQRITVHPPSEEQLSEWLAASPKDETTQRQAYFLSGGLPGLLHALVYNDAEHPLLTSVSLAKEVLQKNTFERLALADSLSKQKDSLYGLLEALERIARTGLTQAAAKEEPARIKQWHHIRRQAVAARRALDVSANPKLTVTNLFLHL